MNKNDNKKKLFCSKNNFPAYYKTCDDEFNSASPVTEEG